MCVISEAIAMEIGTEQIKSKVCYNVYTMVCFE